MSKGVGGDMGGILCSEQRLGNGGGSWRLIVILYMRIGVFSSDGTIIFMVFSIVILNREINFQYTRGVYISYIT